MTTFSRAGLASRALPRRRFNSRPQSVASYAKWACMSRIGWIATTVLLAFLLWQVAAVQPLWSPAVSGLLLISVSVLAGLRIGADSLAAYTNDVHRRNKLLADQNRELQDSNATLLKQVRSRSRQHRGLPPSGPAIASAVRPFDQAGDRLGGSKPRYSGFQ